MIFVVMIGLEQRQYWYKFNSDLVLINYFGPSYCAHVMATSVTTPIVVSLPKVAIFHTSNSKPSCNHSRTTATAHHCYCCTFATEPCSHCLKSWPRNRIHRLINGSSHHAIPYHFKPSEFHFD